MTTTNDRPLTHDELRQFTGDLLRYQHSINRRVIYTPGVRHLANRAGAYWLIDEIALALADSELMAAAATDPRELFLHFWSLTVSADCSAVLAAWADSDVPPFVSSLIPWTDFPLDRIDIWAGFDGERWTLYLPSEH